MKIDALQGLFKIGEQTKAIEEDDHLYIANRVRSLVGDKLKSVETDGTPTAICDALVEIAIQNNKISGSITEKEILASQLMDLVTPRPSVINRTFNELYAQEGSSKATDYFYNLCRAENDIQVAAIAKNIEFEANGLEITINLSKPEKDPKAIAQAAHEKENSYPLCQLCLENEGYLGRVGYPARSNHRIVKITVGKKEWGFQYSPYAYFSEHAIFIDRDHVPMVINRQTFANLIEIIQKFPDYFVGSNADLPIVGGSMLSHEHYQGGRHQFPMMKASVTKEVELPDKFDEVSAGVVKWAMTDVRLESENAEQLEDAAEWIREKWNLYTDESVDIRAEVKGERHHTVTPIAYMNGKQYVIDIVLRDNQVSEKYPDGIFHPHPDVQHIKKENIGLIEVMGRAIFPPRLLGELKEVRKMLLDQPNEIAEYHVKWAEELKKNNQITLQSVDDVINNGVGEVFERVLSDAGVFKQNKSGEIALKRFLDKLI